MLWKPREKSKRWLKKNACGEEEETEASRAFPSPAHPSVAGLRLRGRFAFPAESRDHVTTHEAITVDVGAPPSGIGGLVVDAGEQAVDSGDALVSRLENRRDPHASQFHVSRIRFCEGLSNPTGTFRRHARASLESASLGSLDPSSGGLDLDTKSRSRRGARRRRRC